MQTLYKSLLVTTLCAAVSVFIFADVSYAGGGHSGSKVKVHVRAELEPLETHPISDADGQMRHIKESRKGVTKVDQFKGTVKIPIPSDNLLITNEEEAENAVIRLILSNAGGTTFAECVLVFDEIEDEDDDERQAEYKVFMRFKKGAVQAKKGECKDTSGELVVPNAQVDDVVTATVNGTNFLQGTFERH